jgi:hypothetical protein
MQELSRSKAGEGQNLISIFYCENRRNSRFKKAKKKE